MPVFQCLTHRPSDPGILLIIVHSFWVILFLFDNVITVMAIATKMFHELNNDTNSLRTAQKHMRFLLLPSSGTTNMHLIKSKRPLTCTHYKIEEIYRSCEVGWMWETSLYLLRAGRTPRFMDPRISMQNITQKSFLPLNTENGAFKQNYSVLLYWDKFMPLFSPLWWPVGNQNLFPLSVLIFYTTRAKFCLVSDPQFRNFASPTSDITCAICFEIVHYRASVQFHVWETYRN